MPVAIMDTASEFSLLAPNNGLHETLISAKKQDLYALELRFSPVALSYTGREGFEDDGASELNEGPEDNWLVAHLCRSVLDSESLDGEFLDSLGLEDDNDILAVPIFPTLLSSEEIDSLFDELSTDAANSLYKNTSGHFDGELSDSPTHSSQELDNSIFSVPTSAALSTSSVEIMLNESFSEDAVKPCHVNGVPTANTESINNQQFPEQPPEALPRRPKPASRTQKRGSLTRAKGQGYSPKRRSHTRTTEWANVRVRVEKAGIECENGEVTEYRATRYGWRSLSRAGAIKSTSTEVDVEVYSWLEDGNDIAVWDPKFIKYLDVRPKGEGFVVQICHDPSRRMFSGFDRMNKKHLRVGYSQVKALLERPKESVILGHM